MYRQIHRNKKHWADTKAATWVSTPSQQLQSSRVLPTSLKGISPWPSGQAQQEHLKHGRRKGETANPIARANLELLKIILVIINWVYAIKIKKKIKNQYLKQQIYNIFFYTGLSFTSLVQMLLPNTSIYRQGKPAKHQDIYFAYKYLQKNIFKKISIWSLVDFKNSSCFYVIKTYCLYCAQT